MPMNRYAFLISAPLLLGALCAAQSAVPEAPLVVGHDSRLVIMEYEAWWGPNAVTVQGTAANPFLQSADMQAVGGGYDSADPVVIQRHVSQLENMGMDAALIEVTNNVSCIFNSEWFIKKYKLNCSPTFRLQNQTIRNNTGNLYPAWSALGTRLKLIPLMGGIDQDVLYADVDGKTAFEKEIEYFGSRMHEHPNLNVIYQGKPLMLVFLGAGQDPNIADNPLWYQIRKFLKHHPEIADKYTFRLMAGYLDAQPALWAAQGIPDGPVKISPHYGFWSWIDRLNNKTCAISGCPYYPSYNQTTIDGVSRRENFTAAIATAGAEAGWGCPDPNAPPYCADDSLRYGDMGQNNSYATFREFMAYARQLDPIFLIIHQFNEFVQPDEGFDANTDDDIEPADLWGRGAIYAVRREVRLYRRSAGEADQSSEDALRP